MTIFVFDSGPLIDLFRHYYRTRFPTLWRRFDRLVEDGRVTSTREVRNELRGRASLRERRRKADRLAEWCDEHASLFPKPSVEELAVVREILEVPHHRALISRQKSLHGGPVADPFVIARAKRISSGCVVTTERMQPNAAKIPNVCEVVEVEWVDLEGFMEKEQWVF